MTKIIEVNNVNKSFGKNENINHVLNGASMSVDQGEFVSLMGASGSGKSTLMNMLGCLDVPTSGIYLLHGSDVSLMTDDELSDIRNKEIGFIFQGFNLISNLTAFENVELPLIYRGVKKSERTKLAEEALRKVGLENRMDHKPSEMSGGQQQRVAIARAIAQAPPVILADEPTGNLDSHSTKEIMSILKGLHAEGRTVIIITHDNEIAANASRIVHIEDGRITSDSSNDGHLSRDDIARQIKESETDNHPVSGVEDEADTLETDSELTSTGTTESEVQGNDDYDINDINDSDIDLHLNGEK